MTPDHGARLELQLAGAPEAGKVRYRYTVASKDCTWRGHLDMSCEDGRVELGESSFPDWLEALFRSHLRVLWRTGKDTGSWPRRLTRWRDAPKGHE